MMQSLFQSRLAYLLCLGALALPGAKATTIGQIQPAQAITAQRIAALPAAQAAIWAQ